MPTNDELEAEFIQNARRMAHYNIESGDEPDTDEWQRLVNRQRAIRIDLAQRGIAPV